MTPLANSITYSRLLFICLALAVTCWGQNLIPYENDDTPPEGNGFGLNLELTPETPEELSIDFSGRSSYDPKSKTLSYEDPIEINTNTGSQLFADRAVIYLEKGFVHLQGHVTIYQGPTLSRAASAKYYWKEEKIESQNLRSGFPPFFLQTKSLKTVTRDGKRVVIADQGQMTTHDHAEPNYWFKASELTIEPSERVVFRDLKFEAGDNTLLYLPYLSQNFDRRLGFQILPGARNIWGPFLRMSYGIPLGGEKDPDTGIVNEAPYTIQGLLDLRARRGVGVGINILNNARGNVREDGFGRLNAYFTHDLDPSIQRTSIRRTGQVRKDRYRIALEERFDLNFLDQADRGADWYFDANLNLLSDRFLLEDFFLRQFQQNPAPDNTLALVRQTDSSVLTALARLRINDFYTSDTRSPEIYFDQVKRPIFGSSILHEGQTSFGVIQEKLPGFRINALEDELATLAPGDPRAQAIQARLSPFGYSRFHTYQEFTTSLRVRDWLSVAPRIGAGFTSYQGVDGPVNDDTRTLVTAGIDTSLKWSKSYPQLENRRWGLDGLVHTVQPYLSFSYVATDELAPSFPAIDRLVPTTRPRPINVGRFTAIDEIQDWSIIRAGVRNLLMTRRDKRSHQWLSWDLYVDGFIQDPEFNRQVSNLYSQVDWSPLPWMRVGVNGQLPVFDDNSDFSEINTAVSVMTDKNTEIRLSHRLLDSHPILIDSNLLILQMFHRFNDEWGLSSYHRWEFDDQVLEEQRYSITRDLGAWNASLGMFLRDNRARDEYGVILGFTLKAFPELNLPVSIDAN